MIFDKLKKLLVEEKDPKDIFNLFFSLYNKWSLSKRCQFIQEPMKNELLVKLLHDIKILLKEEKISNLNFLEIPIEKFYQGKFSIYSTSFPCLVFYFSDINIGIFSYFNVQSSTYKMFQFSTTDITDHNTTLH